MLRFLTVVGLVLLVALLVTTGWPALRGIRRSRRTALPALRLRPTAPRGAVLRALRISRERTAPARLVGSPASGHRLLVRPDRHLTTLADAS
jgi:hypothetical protein